MPVVSLRWRNCRFGLIKGVQDGKLTLVFTHKGIAKDGKKAQYYENVLIGKVRERSLLRRIAAQLIRKWQEAEVTDKGSVKFRIRSVREV